VGYASERACLVVPSVFWAISVGKEIVNSPRITVEATVDMNGKLEEYELCAVAGERGR
jgi:hypothetical protein